jgi:hypothetical protein
MKLPVAALSCPLPNTSTPDQKRRTFSGPSKQDLRETGLSRPFDLKRLILCATMLVVFAAVTWAQTLIYSVQNGRWSDPNTWWGNQVPTCDFVVVKNSVVLDQDIGTGCGGSKWIRVENTGSLTADNSQPRIILFASTGNDPVGSGNAFNPGADATMFGFMVSGVLDLEGHSDNWLTLSSYNDSSPIYIHHQANDYVGCTMIVNNVCNGGPAVNGAVLKVRYVNARHLGTTVQYFDGISWDMENGTTPANSLDVQLSQFTDLNQIVHYYFVTSSGGYNFSRNTMSAPRQQYTINVFSAQTPRGWIITDNTETGGLVPGQFIYFVGTPADLTFARNAVLGTSAVQRGLLRLNGTWGDGNNNTLNNFCYDPEPADLTLVQCILYSGPPNETTSTITGNVLFGSIQPLAILGGSPQVTYNWFDEFQEANFGQGDLIAYGDAANQYVAYNIHLLESDNGNILSLLISDAGHQFLTAHAEHNTYVGVGMSSGLYLGEGSVPNLAVYDAYARDNLVVGGNGGIIDGNPLNQWSSTQSYNGAGVHHNDVFNVTVPYPQPLGPSHGFDDGLHPHPDARYGDITADPGFVDATRRPTGFDASLGGPGTIDHLFAQLALRNGFGGSYDPRYNIPDLLNWLRAGFAPRNQFLRGKAHDGTSIGAVPVSPPGCPDPRFTPPGGTYTSRKTVSLHAGSCRICFTTDGTTPTTNGAGSCIHGTHYITVIPVLSSERIEAIATQSGWNDSNLVISDYVITGLPVSFADGTMQGGKDPR